MALDAGGAVIQSVRLAVTVIAVTVIAVTVIAVTVIAVTVIAVTVIAGSLGAAGSGHGDGCGRGLVRVRGHLVREWPGRKRWNVGFRSSRDEFSERPAREQRLIFSGGVISVFRLSLAGLLSSLGRFW